MIPSQSVRWVGAVSSGFFNGEALTAIERAGQLGMPLGIVLYFEVPTDARRHADTR